MTRSLRSSTLRTTELSQNNDLSVETMPKRIYPAFRNQGVRGSPDDDVPIIGADIEIAAAHSLAIAETQSHRLATATKIGHRNKLKMIIARIKAEYPDYATAGGVKTLTEDQLTNPEKCYHKNTEDLAYSGMNIRIIMAFMSANKTLTGKKKAGKFRSYSDWIKFHNSILFGAREAEENLSREYYSQMEDLSKSYKKETAKKKGTGEMDENDSDPITFPLYRLICQWALESGCIFVWVFTLLQWNCMGRSINIDSLGFHNFTMGSDSIKAKYDNSKADQAGEKVSPKNIYANPFDPVICAFVGLGVWLSLRHEVLMEHESFFLGVGKVGTAGARYCSKLAELLSSYVDQVRQFSRPERTHGHGIRKGSAIHVTSGTTVPPPLPSVAARGEWSQGLIFDVYLLFAEPGDQYLGRCLAGLNPNLATFATLPPHFTLSASNPDVAEALLITFGDLGDHYNVTAILLFLLASLVFSIEFIRRYAAASSTHPFNQLPLLQHPELIDRLTALVTTKPSNVLSQATGVPPHVIHAVALEKLLHTTTQTLDKLVSMTEEIKLSVSAAIEAHDRESGQITMSLLMEKLSAFKGELVEAVVAQTGGGLLQRQEVAIKKEPLEGQARLKDGLPGYFYSVAGRNETFWHVPKGWSFPKKTLRQQGWDMWIRGQPGNEYNKTDQSGNIVRVAGPVRPFRLIEPQFLPSKPLKEALKSQWKPVFAIMEECQTNVIPSNYREISTEVVHQTFAQGTKRLKERAGYIWELDNAMPEQWALSNWCKHVKPGAIEAAGTDTDKLALPTTRRSAKSRQEQQQSSKNAAPAGGSVQPRPPKRQKKQLSSLKEYAERVTNPSVDLTDDDDLPEDAQSIGNGSAIKHRVPGPCPAEPTKGKELIQMQNLVALNSQGFMIAGCCLRAYFNILACKYWTQGVRRTNLEFFKEGRTWDEYVAELKASSKDGSQFIDWENDQVIFCPIFRGPSDTGHFALLIVDRTLYSPGLFWLCDTYPSFSPSLPVALEAYLKTTPLWKEGSVFHALKAGKTMPKQGKGTNDCGIWACCIATAYIMYLLDSKAFERSPSTESCGVIRIRVECKSVDAETWGLHGRRHIARCFRAGDIVLSDTAMHNLSVLVLVDPKPATPIA